MSDPLPARSRRKRFRGIVVSAGTMAKTVRVEVKREIWHPKVKKHLRRKRIFLVHDESGRVPQGAIVEIEETRPISRHKHFRIANVLGELGKEQPS